MEEIWKDIEGYKGLYQVSSLGRVKSLDRVVTYKNGREQSYKSRILKPKADKDGYLLVNLYINKSSRTCKVHRLVAAQFIKNPDQKQQVNHIDGCKTNNVIKNLEWVTPKENLSHASLEGLLSVGSNHHNSSLIESDIIEIFKLSKSGMSQNKIAKVFNINQNAIWKILNRKTWRHVETEDSYAV